MFFFISSFMFSRFPVLCIVRTLHVPILMFSDFRFILLSIWFVALVSLVDRPKIPCFIFCRTRHLSLLDRDMVDVICFLHCLYSVTSSDISRGCLPLPSSQCFHLDIISHNMTHSFQPTSPCTIQQRILTN